jgi:hypothetical protein
MRVRDGVWWLGAGAIPAVCVGWTAQAAVRAIVAHAGPSAARHGPARAPAPLPVAPAAPAAQAAPAPGTTGTAPLPALPVPADWAEPAGVVAARPFSLAGASAVDRGRALDCLASAIYYEAASESDAGQRAVAQVVLNRVRHPAFPATVCGVVYQGSEKRGCQFSFACDGAMARQPSRSGWLRALAVASAALNGQVFAPVGLATHYHTYAVTPAWNRALVMTDAIGAHFFHRWKGWWGTPAAFAQRYAGGEPLPGPHAPLLPAPAPLPPLVLAAAAPVTPRPLVQPAHADSGTVRPEVAPQSGDVLERWKDSGQPLK